MKPQKIDASSERPRIGFSAQQAMATARETTGVEIIDSSIEEGLSVLLHSLHTEAKLNATGVAAHEKRLLRLLSNRLRMLRDFRAHPEIAKQEIIAPLFITGGPRTGSTKLHKMLAAGGDFIYLPFWQGHCLSLRSGDRNEDPADRIQEAQEYVHWMDQYAPGAQYNHGYGTFEAEEEALIFEHSFSWIFHTVFAEIPSYLQWQSTREFRQQARFLKQTLQYLQWQFHDGDPRRWLLKAPAYSGDEPVLAEVFSGAHFVSTHRHPVKSVPSTANLVNGYRVSCSDADWRLVLGGAYCEGLAMGTEKMMAVRDSHPALNILDISFAALTEQAEKVVETVYSHLGMTLSDVSRRNMLEWDLMNQAPRSESKGYALGDFGLTKEMIDTRFKRYIDRFESCF